MKQHRLFLVAITLVLALPVWAQKRVSPGLRAGINVATLSNINADFKTDAYAGFMLGLNLGRQYTLQPELTYTRQGAKDAVFEEEGGATRREDVTIQYLSLGVMNKFYLTEGNNGVHALVGPSLDMKVGRNFPRIDFEDDDYGGVDLGISLGIGYTAPFGLTVEGRFKTGLLDAFNNDYFLGMFEDPDRISLNRVFQIGIGFSF